MLVARKWGLARRTKWVWRLGLGFLVVGGGAVVAGWLTDHRAAWVGGIVLAVTGAFGPPLVDWLKGRSEAREALRRASELPGEGPARLLDPRRGLVDFTGREKELAELIAWCQDGRPRGVRLVTGPGGVGKTRLSVELCARLEQQRWRCVRAGDQEEAAALAAARRVWPGRIMLVVDYAETRVGLRKLLRDVATDAGPIRVLLLARSAGEWWDRLRGGDPAVRDLLAGAGGEDPLPVAVSGELSNTELVLAAVPVFTAALGVTAPSRVLVDVRSGAVRVLDLHAAALVAVLRSAAEAGPVSVSVFNVLDELLEHEERFWEGSADRLDILAGTQGMTPAVLRQVVAAGALLGAASQEEAVKLLGRVPGALTSVKVACWLRDLYPPETVPPGGGGPEWLGSLRPDRLAERLVVAQLTASPKLAERCLTGLDDRQALRAVTLLGRAAVDQQEAIAPLLQRVLPLLEHVVADLPDDLELLTAISDAIPYPSATLAEADLAVTRRILQVLPTGDQGLRARWLSWLGTTLAQTGRPAEAVPPTEEAVQIRRELAAADPDRYRPDLAKSLSNLGNRFYELGRPAEALPPTQQAVQIRRELAAADPDRYRPDLAESLSNLGLRFYELGRPGEALPPTQQAVDAYRELAAADPDRYRPYLAIVLNNLGNRFSQLGRPGEALPPTQQAVQIRQELAAANPDRYRPDLAKSLSNLGLRFYELGRSGEALPPTQQAVDAYRELAAAYPGRYQSDLARALSNLGIMFSQLDRRPEALSATQQAVGLYQELAAANPGPNRPNLAAALSNLGIWFAELGRPAEALPPAQQAVDLCRELAAAYPGRYQSDLAHALSNLGIIFSQLDRRAEALSATQQAVGLYQELAAANPGQYRRNLTTALSNLGLRLSELGRAAEALRPAQQAVDLCRELAADDPDLYRPDLERSLQIIALVQDGLRRRAEAEAGRDADLDH